jgi:hypothetical protein
MERRRCVGCDKVRAGIMAKIKRSSGAIRSTGGAYVRGSATDPVPKAKATKEEA